MFQHHWRCAHYPSAIENFSTGRTTCEHGCHLTELRWWHNGTNPEPPLKAFKGPATQRGGSL